MPDRRRVDPKLVLSWLSGRSVARGVAQPVADRGGFRVDSNTEEEVRRWVFPQAEAGLSELGRAVHETRHFLKLCGEADELRAILPSNWQLHAPSYFMQASGGGPQCRLPDGYKAEVDRRAAVVKIRIWSQAGALAASGYASDTPDAFVYDRIMTVPEYRRKGLGRAVMSMLRAYRRHAGSVELLVATEDGRALYTALGWRTISPYSTASIPAS